jgi:hypothetical protein
MFLSEARTLQGGMNAKNDICWNDSTRSHYWIFPSLYVAILAARRNLCATRHRVPRVLRPLDL